MELWRAIFVTSVILVLSLAFGAVVGAITKSVAEKRSTLFDPDLRRIDIREQVECNVGFARLGAAMVFAFFLMCPLIDFFDKFFG